MSIHNAGTAGKFMAASFLAALPDETAGDVVSRLRNEIPEDEAVFAAYVVTGQGRLVGWMPLWDLALAPKEAKLCELARPIDNYVLPGDRWQTVARKMLRLRLPSLAVVDRSMELLGVVTLDNVVRRLAPRGLKPRPSDCSGAEPRTTFDGY